MTGSNFIETKYKGIYRDNGLTVLVGKWNKVRITQLFEDFQSWVNELTEGDYLQFTTDIWNPITEVTLIAEKEKEWTGINKETKKK
eukprot:9635364-Ditylum_brightwellii.AAC.1